tara:strand:+ start:397 stop:597 length:201 start_codon:yes stop_codon:yes gene_type:complete
MTEFLVPLQGIIGGQLQPAHIINEGNVTLCAQQIDLTNHLRAPTPKGTVVCPECLSIYRSIKEEEE